MFTAEPHRKSLELSTMAGFVEVWLAKEGHDGLVGINFLEKIQMPTPSTLYGSLLAGVDVVLVGAGIPRDIPRLLDRLSAHEPVAMPLHVDGGEGTLAFDPRSVIPEPGAPLARPMFLAIIASTALAISLARKTPGVDGFVIEGPTAGGHNAPPRGVVELVDGEPLYGPRDEVDLEKVGELGLPFWLAGGQATPERLREAQAAGAAGIQVGTAFAFCEESGLDPLLRTRVLHQVRAGRIGIFTDPLASPTGFPFKVIELDGTLSEDDVVEARERRCDLGYLRVPYEMEEGRLGYRCPAEPIEDYVRKGGDIADTVGRKCICNGLTSTIGLGTAPARGAGAAHHDRRQRPPRARTAARRRPPLLLGRGRGGLPPGRAARRRSSSTTSTTTPARRPWLRSDLLEHHDRVLAEPEHRGGAAAVHDQRHVALRNRRSPPASPRGARRRSGPAGPPARPPEEPPDPGLLEVGGARVQLHVAEPVDPGHAAPEHPAGEHRRRRARAPAAPPGRSPGPIRSSGTPFARCAPAGANTSRPWNVFETGCRTTSAAAISAAASAPPSASQAIESSPLSGPPASHRSRPARRSTVAPSPRRGPPPPRRRRRRA